MFLKASQNYINMTFEERFRNTGNKENFPAECVQFGRRRTPYVGSGMFNDGNTCYINSTLQALFHVPAFVNWLQSESSHLNKCISLVNKRDCTICAMDSTYVALQNKLGTVIRPYHIYRRLSYICKHLVAGG
ncbi:ubiquitin carboxyl-terminal hydrolase 36-like [Zootermopsis nevadensis]|uniref:Ubiquitin carboxyl-terminal hydrolase 36 n=1 Tax=Zootermopsis nevadensis TaxID=136037 RepID=A0A067RCD2_ZOONE|nr:ubiquitin carboxyl-terminal hydrolase 36-like [Zootermopsis nevadensis]KDR20522.1 Ubiquitin carboxyl-terminal hydrolase 36 [Zootermopsis nevadensis]